MKQYIIVALLLVGVAMLGFNQAEAKLTEKAYNKIESCNIQTNQCQIVAKFLNDMILQDPSVTRHLVDFKGTTNWLDVLPKKTLALYSLYHPDFYYGQRIPVGIEMYYCYDCDPYLALEIEEKYRIKLYIVSGTGL